MKKTVFITGSTGLLGVSILPKLKKEFNVIQLSNNSSIKHKNIKYLDYSSKIKINKFINKYKIPDYFLHIGWGKMTDPLSKYHVKENYLNSKNLLDTFFKRGLKNFIFIGTIVEYGPQKKPVPEKTKPLKNLRNYEIGKYMFGKYGVKTGKKMKKTFTHIRMAYLYGPVQKKNSLIYTLHDSYYKKTKFKVSPLNFYRDYMFSEEAAEGIIKIIKKNTKSLVINLGSGKYIYMKDFIKKYWKIIGGKNDNIVVGKLKNPKNETKPSKFYMKLNLLKKITGWKPPNNVNKNIKTNIKLCELQ
ncbi:MAG: hypothetical protein CBC24_02495 [Candidatus Pelagibacter sp. TMED64]|nr:hypothetical protein [Candidatus Pelagibacter sp.]OUU66833.1 MAG: hypothetical protein CBC24_02495 [Candidatus Pelagibacter sp. TMED64]|tara:strand:+ start:156 stop:1058 length:903 start_codon:yes stop_codon:yes gene_type:complete